MSIHSIRYNARSLFDCIHERLDALVANGMAEDMGGGGYSITLESQPTHFINLHIAREEAGDLPQASFHYFGNEDDGGFTYSDENPPLWFTYTAITFDYHEHTFAGLTADQSELHLWDERLRRMCISAGLAVMNEHGVIDGQHKAITPTLPKTRRDRRAH